MSEVKRTYEKDQWYDVTIENVEMRQSKEGIWLMNFWLKNPAHGGIAYLQRVDDQNRGYVVKLLTRFGVSVEDMAKEKFWEDPNSWLKGVNASIRTEEYNGKLKVKVLTGRKAQRISQFAPAPEAVASFAKGAAAMFKLDGVGAGGDEPW